jgi:hypothetical protein
VGDTTVNEPWEVLPFVGIGPVRLGDAREHVRAVLGADPDVFERGEDEVHSYAVGAFVYGDVDDAVEFVEVFEPAVPMYRNVKLLDGSLEEVTAKLAAAGVRLCDDRDGGFIADEHGFVLYAPVERIETVAVFRRGYYDEFID